MAPIAITQTQTFPASTVSSAPMLKVNGSNKAAYMNGSSTNTNTNPNGHHLTNGLSHSLPPQAQATQKSMTVTDPTYPTLNPNASVRDEFAFDSMEDALAAFARGEFLVVMDDEDRENEGDLIIAAEKCTTEKMAWMIRHTRYVSRDYSMSKSAQNSSFYPFIFISLGSGICVHFLCIFHWFCVIAGTYVSVCPGRGLMSSTSP